MRTSWRTSSLQWIQGYSVKNKCTWHRPESRREADATTVASQGIWQGNAATLLESQDSIAEEHQQHDQEEVDSREVDTSNDSKGNLELSEGQGRDRAEQGEEHRTTEAGHLQGRCAGGASHVARLVTLHETALRSKLVVYTTPRPHHPPTANRFSS